MLSFLLALPSHAFIYSGNPELTLHIGTPGQPLDEGDVVLDQIDLLPCSQGPAHHIFVDETIDPVAGFTFSFPSGDWCTAVAVWDSDITLESAAVTLVADPAATSVDISGGGGDAALVPFEVTSGQLTGDDPLVEFIW